MSTEPEFRASHQVGIFMRRGTLNVDTRSNTFVAIFTCPLVRKDAHALFDKGGIILLPEGDVVEKYRRHGKPDFDED
ncbi:hypothetical protein BC826DRAFT_1062958, partial [Russula brevipes]